MTKDIVIKAKKREAKKDSNKELRNEGLIPAVVYGKIDNQAIAINKLEFEKAYAEVGESSLIDLEIDGKKVKVIIKDILKDPVRGDYMHADLYAVDMTKKITAETNLNFIGESKAVKEMAATLIKNRESLEVSCLPDKLLSHIDVDLSKLETFDDSIKIKDLVIPEGVEFILDENELIASVLKPAKQEERKEAQEEDGKKDDGKENEAKKEKSTEGEDKK